MPAFDARALVEGVDVGERVGHAGVARRVVIQGSKIIVLAAVPVGVLLQPRPRVLFVAP
jgi:hypothetical protein